MKLKILHLEDNVMKQIAITRVIQSVADAEIIWVSDMASGMEKIEEAIKQNEPFDLAITDMHYPLSKDSESDLEAGETFIAEIKNRNLNLPVIICSSVNRRNNDILGCVWYHEAYDWESQMRELINQVLKEKASV